MMEFDRFAWPWFFALTGVIPLLLVVWALRRRPSVLYSATPVVAASGATIRARLAWLPGAIRLACLALLAIALARPQSIDHKTNRTTEGVALQLVLDRSGSMDEEATVIDGRQVRRLDAAKEVLTEFIKGNGRDLKGREGDLLGLIAFGSYADTIAPLTQDHQPIVDLLDGVDASLIREERGTAIGDALALAAARLASAEKALADSHDDADFKLKGKAIVLLTDGENTAGSTDPRDAARLAASLGIHVYAIGIRGGVQRGFFRTQSIDEGLLTDIAEMTGGRFWAVDSGDQLRDIYAEIDTLEKTEIRVDAMTEYRERFTPFALGALACLVAEILLRATWLRRLP
ncbi:MAG: VWA domain-containing protein [Phycisphaerales bacterium]